MRAEHTGSLRARREVRIHTLEEGRISDLPFAEGDRIERGGIVARLDDTLLQGELAKARARRHQAEVDLERLAGLVERRLATPDEQARAQTTLEVARAEEALLKTRIGYTTIRAPFDGVISLRRAEPGDISQRHSHLPTLIDPDSLLFEAQLSELLIPSIGPGDRVAVRIDAIGGKVVAGQVERIHPTIDPRTRMGVVEIALAAPPVGARPGQLARVTLSATTRERLSVPFHALRRDSEGEHLYIYEPDSGKVARRSIRSGLRIADQVAILEGVQPGELVVSKGFLGLNHGMKVEVVNQSANKGEPS